MLATVPSPNARALRPFVERHWRVLLAGVLLLALGARIAMLLGLRESVYGSFLFWDERTYDRWARAIVAREPYYVYSVSPLPAYVTAVVYRLLGTEPLFVRLVNTGLDLGTCAFLFAIGRRLSGPAAGVAAALVGALYQPFVLFGAAMLKESLGLFLFAWTIALVLAEGEEHRGWRTLLLGAVVGLLVNVRQNAAVVPIVALPWIAWRLARRTSSWRAPALAVALACAGFAATTAPFAVANLRGTGRLSPVPLGGFDFYRGNVLEGPTPYYNPVPFSSTDPDTQGVEFLVEARRRSGRTLSLAQASDYWSRRVIRNAREHPAAFARRLLVKAGAAVNRWEEGDNHSLPFLRDHVPFLRVPLFAFWLVMPLGMAGLLSLAVAGDGRARMLLAVVLAYGGSMVLVFSNMRIRAPLMIILIPYAICGLQRAARALRARPRAALGWAAAVAAFVALELLPVPGTGDLTAHYNTHAAALVAQNRTEEALEWWRRSSEAQGTYSHFADLSLATIAFGKGDLPTAWRMEARVPRDSHAAALKYALMGSMLAADRRAREAAMAFELSLSLNTARIAPLTGAIEVNRMVDHARARQLAGHLKYLQELYGPLLQARGELPPAGRR